MLPWSIESVLSLIPSPEPFPETFTYAASPQLQSGIAGIDTTVGPVLSQSLTPAPGASANPTQIWSALLSWAWAAGAGLMLLYALVSWLLLKLRMADAVRFRENIYQSDRAVSPFVLGLVKPRIYLPYDISPEDMEQVLAHEQSHIRRRDHWWKPLGFVLLAVFWFHPLLWVAYILFCRDIEAACDEKVVSKLSHAQRQAYSMALLNCAVHHRSIAACPLAFGELGVKERIRSVMHYKKPGFWIVLGGLLIGLAVALCFLTDPPVTDAETLVTQDPVAQDPSTQDPVTQESRTLTLNDVIILSQKGDGLTRLDFSGFDHRESETGFGYTIVRDYDINSYYRLRISYAKKEGTLLDSSLTYLPTGNTLDIRGGGVTEFISENEIRPEGPGSIQVKFRNGINEIDAPREMEAFWAFLKVLKTELEETELSSYPEDIREDDWNYYTFTVDYTNGQREVLSVSKDGQYIWPQYQGSTLLYSVRDPEALMDLLDPLIPKSFGYKYEWSDAMVLDHGAGWASIRIIEGWEYELVNEEDNMGIRCRPQEVDSGWIYYSFWKDGYSPEETDDRYYAEGDFCGHPTVASYPGSVVDTENSVWSYFCIRFDEIDFTMVNDGADEWFLEYKEQICDTYYIMAFYQNDALKESALNG